MSSLDIETKRKMRDMNATEMLQAIEAQNETLSMALIFDERVRLIVDEAHSAFTTSKVGGLITRAKLRYPNADLRQLDLIEERGLNRNTLTAISSCGFIEQNQNVVFQGFTVPENRIWGAPWRNRPAATGSAPTTCACPTSRKNGSRPKTKP